MTEVQEETEPESSFKESKEKFFKNPIKQGINTEDVEPIPEVHHEHESADAHQQDREDEFSSDDEGAQDSTMSFNFTLTASLNKQDQTFKPEKKDDDVDVSRLCSVEQIREYLEKELGIDTLMKIYPIIKEFGDDILFADKV